ncbi:hypothetical protein D9M68_692450 [compost metagenome]
MLAQVDRLAGVHEYRLVAALVQVMHGLTEPRAFRVHVLGATCLGATGRLEFIHGLLGSLDQTLDTLSRRRQPVGTGNGVVRKMLLLPIDQCSNLCTSHAGALWVKLWVGDCLFGLHPLKHQHRHQLGAFLPRKTRVGADQATGFVKALVEVAKGAALGRLQAVVLVLPEGIGRRGGRLTRRGLGLRNGDAEPDSRACRGRGAHRAQDALRIPLHVIHERRAVHHVAAAVYVAGLSRAAAQGLGDHYAKLGFFCNEQSHFATPRTQNHERSRTCSVPMWPL